MITSVANTVKQQTNQTLMVCCRVPSHVSTSLLNLFSILPSGVVSKKVIGECIICSNIFRCKCFAALIIPIVIAYQPYVTNTACAIPNTPFFREMNLNYK